MGQNLVEAQMLDLFASHSVRTLLDLRPSTSIALDSIGVQSGTACSTGLNKIYGVDCFSSHPGVSISMNLFVRLLACLCPSICPCVCKCMLYAECRARPASTVNAQDGLEWKAIKGLVLRKMPGSVGSPTRNKANRNCGRRFVKPGCEVQRTGFRNTPELKACLTQTPERCASLLTNFST